MVRKMIAAILLLVLASLLGSAGVTTAKAGSCSVEHGQILIESGEFKKAIQEFSCVVAAQPGEVEGYRGLIEAELLSGRFANALQVYTRVTAVVIPVNPDAEADIMAGYADRLSDDPDSIAALTGKSFAQWYFFHYPQAIQTLNDLLAVQPDNLFGNLFRGSSRVLKGANTNAGIADLEYAISLAPASPDVHFIVADAYTYGLPDPERASSEAMLALDGGLDTPRIHAILAAALLAFGDEPAAAEHIKTHIDMVTTAFVQAAPLTVGSEFSLDLVPGRTYVFPVTAAAGETVSITTGSPDFWDTILVLLDEDGNPLAGSDDANWYFGALEWTAPESGTYFLQVTSFESISTGLLEVSRD